MSDHPCKATFDFPFNGPLDSPVKSGSYCYDPDSSPAAWEYYKKVYVKDGSLKLGKTEFDANRLSHCNLEKGFFSIKHNSWLSYKDQPIIVKENQPFYNRLYALKTNTKRDGIYCEAASRVGGECDFNFNEGKKTRFEKIIKNDSNAAEESKNEALEKLDECAKMHHNLLNFSLMQAMGDLQGVKGEDEFDGFDRRFDRFDTFVWKLSEYYSKKSKEVLKKAKNEGNRNALCEYLDGFKNIYDYCKQVYFIDDQSFIDEVIRQGQLPITNCDNVKRYMSLAQDYWRIKYEYIQHLPDVLTNKKGDNHEQSL